MEPTDSPFEYGKSAKDRITEALAQLSVLQTHARPVARIALAHANRFELAKRNTLARDRAALARKFGTTHPRVRAVDERIETLRSLDVAVESLDARAAAPGPKAHEDIAAVYGRVVGTDGTPAKGFRVVALNPAGKSVGESGTDKNGGYDIRIGIKRTTRGRAAAAAGPAAGEESSAPSLEVRLEVRNAAGSVQYRDSEPLLASAGTSVYREIALPDDRRERSTRGDNTGSSAASDLMSVFGARPTIAEQKEEAKSRRAATRRTKGK